MTIGSILDGERNKTTEEIVAERPEWLKENLRKMLREKQARIIVQLCGTGMAYNEVALMLALVNEALG